MKLAEAGSTQAWQPLTPPGVAAFAIASTGRLALVVLIFAAVAGISVTIFLQSAWFPTIDEATRSLPEVGYIRGGQLAWAGDSPTLLAEDHWLAVTVNLHHQVNFRTSAELQIEFSAESVRFLSYAGYLDIPYPKGWIIVFNQPELGAWWNAWKPFLAAGAGLLTAGGLLIFWALLATLYAIPAGAICRFVEHGIPYSAVWKLCCAAQLPGSLLLSFTLLLYSLRAIELLQWLFVAGAHLVVSWLYILLATFFLPAKSARPKRKPNPFKAR
jgi:hypothetical protein